MCRACWVPHSLCRPSAARHPSPAPGGRGASSLCARLWSGRPPLPPSPQVLVHFLCVMLFSALRCVNYVAGKHDCFQAGLLGTGRRRETRPVGASGASVLASPQPALAAQWLVATLARVETKQTPHKWDQPLKSRYPIKQHSSATKQFLRKVQTAAFHFTVSSLLATARLRWNREAGAGGIYGQ